MSDLTPIEFERDNYKERVQRGDCLVWYNDYPVEWVRKCGEIYELHYDDGYDHTLVGRVRPYEMCLTVEDIRDRAALRERLMTLAARIIEVADDDELVDLRKVWQEQVGFVTWGPKGEEA